MPTRSLPLICLIVLLLSTLAPIPAQASALQAAGLYAATPTRTPAPTRTTTPRTFAPEMEAATTGLSTWRSGPNMLQTRSGPALVAWKDTLFVLGGSTGLDMPLDTIESAKIGSKVILSEWQTARKMSIARSHFKAVALDSYVYLLGGQGLIFNTGSSQAQLAPLVSVSMLRISPEGKIISETPSSQSLPEARWDFGAATARGYIYIAGGLTVSDTQDWQNKIAITSSVIYAPVYADGSLGGWQPATSLDMPMEGVELVAANGYLYAIGGESISQKFNTVRYAPIKGDGSLGKWQRISDMNEARAFAAVMSDDEYLYAIGGDLPMNVSGDAAIKAASSVEYAQIRSDGTLSRWRLTKSLPEARDRLAGVAVSSSVTNISNGYMFIAGGYTGTAGDTNTAMNATGYNFAIGKGPAINVEFAPQPPGATPIPATSTVTPTIDPGIGSTQVAQTVEAILTQTEIARPTATLTFTPEPPSVTPTDLPPSETSQPSPSNTPTLTLQLSDTPQPAFTLTPTPVRTVVGGEGTNRPPNTQLLQTVAIPLGILIALVLIVYAILRWKFKGQRIVFRWPGSKPPNQL